MHRSTLINDYYKSFEVVHLQPTTYYYGNASLYGSGWQTFTDGYGQAGSYAWTTNRGSATAWAQLSASGNTLRCAVAVYVPAGQASANITFGVKMANGSWANRTINENNIDGWALLYKWGEISSAPVLINVGNNNGTTNQQLGVGYMIYIC